MKRAIILTSCAQCPFVRIGAKAWRCTLTCIPNTHLYAIIPDYMTFPDFCTLEEIKEQDGEKEGST